MKKTYAGKQIVILGPTSSGKTALALNLCKKFNGEIVSVDSRQIYKHMDIGTGKVPVKSSVKIVKGEGYWEVDDVKIWGYDIVEPAAYFSVSDYCTFVKNLKFKTDVVFFVGGTGFYFDVLLGRKNISGVEPNIKLREELSKFSIDKLFEKLYSLDSEKANVIDKNNPARLIRAIEVSLNRGVTSPKTKVVIAEAASEKNFRLLGEDSLLIGLKGSRELVYERVDRWVDYIFENGFLKEVENLTNMGFSNTRPIDSLNYKTARLFLSGFLTKKEAIERVKFDNHSYIRRQETYFKKISEVSWFNIGNPSFDTYIQSLVESKLNE